VATSVPPEQRPACAPESPGVDGYVRAVNEHLMSSVLWAAMFFETCSDEECDADLATKQLEQIAWYLRQLAPDEQREFREFVEHAAAEEPRADIAERLRMLVNGLLPE
jgi:hypothetical protein